MLSHDDVIEVSDDSNWRCELDRQTAARMIRSLESGKVLFFRTSILPSRKRNGASSPPAAPTAKPKI